MSTKTISVRLEAYERLKRAKRSAVESFSDVIMRARVEEGKRADHPPEDKWAGG